LQRTEIPNFTREQIEEHVRDAVVIADTLGLEGEDRRGLLPVILDKLTSKQIITAEVAVPPGLLGPNGLG
jgi:hypothetical protein